MTAITRSIRAAVLGATLLASPLALAAPPSASAPGAAALESRLHAPCCYGGTLDTHESELARELRSEIETRLARGETSDAIQSDFVARYGDRVLAARSDRPIRVMSLVVVAFLVFAAVGLALLLRRWCRAPDAPVVALPREDDAALDERIDAELADADG